MPNRDEQVNKTRIQNLRETGRRYLTRSQLTEIYRCKAQMAQLLGGDYGKASDRGGNRTGC